MGDGLQFDQAEFTSEPGAPASSAEPCAMCGTPTASTYYEVAGRAVCPACRDILRARSEGGAGDGGGRRMLVAAGLGLGAALVGAVGWYVVMKITESNLGIVAVAIGWLVGRAVAKGSEERGGLGAQALAVVLTYAAIAGAFLPIALAAGAWTMAPALPVLIATKSPLSGLIFAFALWEAWKLNRPRVLEIAGPFERGGGPWVHAEDLKELAAKAEAAEREGRPSDALAAWRSALDLLPPASRQHEVITLRVRDLAEAVRQGPRAGGARRESIGAQMRKRAGVVGVAALLLFKFKGLILLALTKLKFIVLGLGKAKTFFTMFLSFGVYWTLWGWPFALLFVLSIYVHEMGHVWALHRYGIKATAPMFVPGLGAFIRTKQYPTSVRENADVGLAGPLWGMGAAAFLAGLGLVTGAAIFSGAAHVAALLNIFNLLPVFGLDGAHGFGAISRKGRALVAAAYVAAWAATGEGLVVLVALVMVWKAFDKSAPPTTDRPTIVRFFVLAAGLAALLFVRVPGM